MPLFLSVGGSDPDAPLLRCLRLPPLNRGPGMQRGLCFTCAAVCSRSDCAEGCGGPEEKKSASLYFCIEVLMHAS